MHGLQRVGRGELQLAHEAALFRGHVRSVARVVDLVGRALPSAARRRQGLEADQAPKGAFLGRAAADRAEGVHLPLIVGAAQELLDVDFLKSGHVERLRFRVARVARV